MAEASDCSKLDEGLLSGLNGEELTVDGCGLDPALVMAEANECSKFGLLSGLDGEESRASICADCDGSCLRGSGSPATKEFHKSNPSLNRYSPRLNHVESVQDAA